MNRCVGLNRGFGCPKTNCVRLFATWQSCAIHIQRQHTLTETERKRADLHFCEPCQLYCKGTQGLKCHIGKKHPDLLNENSESSDSESQSEDDPFSSSEEEREATSLFSTLLSDSSDIPIENLNSGNNDYLDADYDEELIDSDEQEEERQATFSAQSPELILLNNNSENTLPSLNLSAQSNPSSSLAAGPLMSSNPLDHNVLPLSSATVTTIQESTVNPYFLREKLYEVYGTTAQGSVEWSDHFILKSVPRKLPRILVDDFKRAIYVLASLYMDQDIPQALRLILELPKRILCATAPSNFTSDLLPRRGSKKNRRQIKTQLNLEYQRNLLEALWRNGTIPALDQDQPRTAISAFEFIAREEVDFNPPAEVLDAQADASLDPLLVDAVHEMIAENADSRAMSKLASSGLVDEQCSVETIGTLIRLHPENQTNTTDNWPAPPHFPANSASSIPAPSADTVAYVIQKLPRSSAPGISGYTFEHFKSLLTPFKPAQDSTTTRRSLDDGRLESTLKSLFITLTRQITSGNLPYRQLFTASRLISLKKKPTGIRPIAIGEAWLRIMGRLVLRSDPIIKKAYDSNIAPVEYVGKHQYGVLTRSGTETVAHSIREAFNSGNAIGLLSLDSKNAFNATDRVTLAQRIAQHAPTHFEYFKWLYQHEAGLYTTDRKGTIIKIHSCAGVRQGDVLASLWYCIGARSILDTIAENFPLAQPFGFVDDTNILIFKPPQTDDDGEINAPNPLLHHDIPRFLVDQANRLLDSVHEQAQPLDNTLQLPKCVLYSPREQWLRYQDELEIPATHEGTVVLGTPIGSDAYITAKVHEKLLKSAQLLERIDLLPSLQDKTLLFRACIATRPIHLARTICLKDGDTSTLFHQWDLCLKATLEKMVGLDNLNPFSIDLPARIGGFGLRSMTGLCSIAFPASLIQSSVIAETQTSNPIVCAGSSLVRCRAVLDTILRFFAHENTPSPAALAEQFSQGILPNIKLPERGEDGIQRVLSIERDKALVAEYRRTMDDGCALLYADTSASSSWLYARPATPQLTIPNDEYVTLMRTRALFTPTPHGSNCPLCDSVVVPANHAYTCRRFSEWRLARHNYQVKLLKSSCPANAQVEAVLDCSRRSSVQSTGPTPINGNLIADLYLPSDRTAVDVTVVVTRPRMTNHLQAQQRAEAAKTAKYRPAMANNAITKLVPFVLGPFGNLGRLAQQFIDTDLAIMNFDARLLKLRCAVAAARATARIILCWINLERKIAASTPAVPLLPLP